MQLTIKRSKWLRGEGSPESRLLRAKDGKMCCLGFLAIALDIPGAHILEVSSPVCVNPVHGYKWPSRLLKGSDCEQIILWNDMMGRADEEREATLKPMFYKLGVSLKFED